MLPVLDGLDELPPHLRGMAVNRINEAMGAGGRGLVLASRSAELRAALRPADGIEVEVAGAAGVELLPVPVEEVVEHLRERGHRAGRACPLAGGGRPDQGLTAPSRRPSPSPPRSWPGWPTSSTTRGKENFSPASGTPRPNSSATSSPPTTSGSTCWTPSCRPPTATWTPSPCRETPVAHLPRPGSAGSPRLHRTGLVAPGRRRATVASRAARAARWSRGRTGRLRAADSRPGRDRTDGRRRRRAPRAAAVRCHLGHDPRSRRWLDPAAWPAPSSRCCSSRRGPRHRALADRGAGGLHHGRVDGRIPGRAARRIRGRFRCGPHRSAGGHRHRPPHQRRRPRPRRRMRRCARPACPAHSWLPLVAHGVSPTGLAAGLTMGVAAGLQAGPGRAAPRRRHRRPGQRCGGLGGSADGHHDSHGPGTLPGRRPTDLLGHRAGGWPRSWGEHRARHRSPAGTPGSDFGSGSGSGSRTRWRWAWRSGSCGPPTGGTPSLAGPQLAGAAWRPPAEAADELPRRGASSRVLRQNGAHYEFAHQDVQRRLAQDHRGLIRPAGRPRMP